MTGPKPTIRVQVDLTNPGQFFACCGLLELADRLWPRAEGWFEEQEFLIAADGMLPSLIKALGQAELIQLDLDDDTSSPLEVSRPFRPLRLDWWQDEESGGKELKVWAGTMQSVRIARAMQAALTDTQFHTPELFDVGVVVYDPDDTSKKVEPYYFDARRAPNAHSRDVGFSPNDLKLTTTAYPAVELLCLAGLARYRPQPTGQPRQFRYYIWHQPFTPALLPAVAAGALSVPKSAVYEFENWYRTGQRKHKAFRSATLATIAR